MPAQGRGPPGRGPRRGHRGGHAGGAARGPGRVDGFTTNFFSAGGELKVTEEQRQAALGLAAQADLHAAAECIASWVTDFTGDLAKVTVPTLVIHGDSDAIVPLEVAGQRTHGTVSGSELHVVAGGPHGLNTSHRAEFNETLLGFLGRTEPGRRG